MTKKISEIPSPAVAGVVRERTARDAVAGIRNCVYDGADMIDLHLSCLEDAGTDVLRTVIGATRLPVLALNYNKTYDWQDAGNTEEQRVGSLWNAVLAGAAGVDMQGYTFDVQSRDGFHGEDIYSFTKGNPKEIVTDEGILARQCEWIAQVHARGAEVLLSCHPGIPMTAEQVVELALFLERRRPDVIKIVTRADGEEDLIESFRAMTLLKKEVGTAVSYHVNGAAGRLSRIVNPLLGGHMIFCTDRYHAGSTMEQPDLKTVRTVIDAMKRMSE